MRKINFINKLDGESKKQIEVDEYIQVDLNEPEYMTIIKIEKKRIPLN